MVGSDPQRLCICGRSSRPPLCDGAHRAADWSCARTVRQEAPFVFLADPMYTNLADRLAHRFDGLSIGDLDGPIRCDRLVVLTGGHGASGLRKRMTGVQHRSCTVLGVGVPVETIGWAFPNAECASLGAQSGVALWAEAEAFLSGGSSHRTWLQKPRLFLSHSHQDEAVLFPVIEALRSVYGLDVFVCADSIPGGTEWHARIETALRERDLFLSIVSESANRSTFCAFEAGMAVALGKPIRLVSLDGTRPPGHLEHLQAEDVPRLQARKPWLPRMEAILGAMLQACASETRD